MSDVASAGRHLTCLACTQAELYSLTSRGGPRYVPRSVNAAAFEVLDALFPTGQRTRRAISMAFRLGFHPLEGPRSAMEAAVAAARLLAWPFIRAWQASVHAVQSFRDACSDFMRRPWHRMKHY